MSTFRILVKSSDRRGAGTDASVYLSLIDKHGRKSTGQCLDNFFWNDFERDREDEFTISTEELDEIVTVEVWRDDSGLADMWNLEYIAVVNTSSEKKVLFPFYRWIHAHKHYFIEAYDTTLPQYTKYLSQRNEELAKRKEEYQYKVNYPGMPLQIKSLPSDEKFSDEYNLDLSATRISLMMEALWVGITRGQYRRFSSVDEIFKVYGYYTDAPPPEGAENWRKDEYFGYQRLNNCNPTLIKLCSEIPENFAIDVSVLRPLLEGKAVNDAIEAKKLFIIDLTVLDGMPIKEGFVMTSPLCLLYLRNDGELVPVAIQLFKKPGPDNPVFYSSDDENLWTLVKMWYNLADATYHQSAGHLGSTHIVMESFWVAFNRTVSPSHPIYKLLAPHFLYLLAIDSRGLVSLMSEGGYVDQYMTAGPTGLCEIMARVLNEIDINQIDLKKSLKSRGVDNEQVLPSYHYRDDAVLVYDIIHNYVSKLIHHFYKTEQDIIDDVELQNFGQEIVSPKPTGLGCINVPGNGGFATHEQVISLLTCLISTCSIQHAAVNFSQYDSYAFPPAYPLQLIGEPPKTKSPLTEDDILKVLEIKKHMIGVLVVGRYLGTRGTKSLGDFEVNYLYSPETVRIVEEFRAELKKAVNIIKLRDENRRIPYQILNPAIIPNSISI